MSLIKKSLVTGIARIFTLPRLSIPLIASLGLTLGAVLCVVAIVSTLMMKPLQGVRNAENLYTIDIDVPIGNNIYFTYWDFPRLANINQAYEKEGLWAGITSGRAKAVIDDSTVEITKFEASNNILDALGTQFIKGQNLDIENPEKHAWISNSLWQQHYAGLDSAINTKIIIDNEQYNIAGVIEDLLSINSYKPILTDQVWLITDISKELRQEEENSHSATFSYLLFRPYNNDIGVPTQEDIVSWQQDYENNNAPSFFDTFALTQQSYESLKYRDKLLKNSNQLLIMLFIAVIGLLVMASLNLLNLFIAHYQSRTKEFGVQLSMGATAKKLKMLVFIENLPSMIIASITGILTAGWIIRALPIVAGNNIPMIDSIHLDGNVIFAAIIIVILLNAVFSMLCLIDINKTTLMENLNSSGKGVKGQSNEWISKVLMILQLSLASILLTASIMLAIKSYQIVFQDLGYEYSNVREISLQIEDLQWNEKLRDYDSYYTSYLKQVEEEIGHILSEQIAGSELIVPGDGPLSSSFTFMFYKDPENDERQITFFSKLMAPGYFETFKIPFIAGTGVSQQHIENQENVTVIDKTAADFFFPELTPEEIIGKELNISEKRVLKVLGVIPTLKHSAGAQPDSRWPVIYRTHDGIVNTFIYTFKLDDNIEIDNNVLKKAVQARFSGIGEVRSKTLTKVWQQQTLNLRTSLSIIVGMTILTIALAAIGVSGLTHMTTNHRKHELAIRMATGASRARLLKLLFINASWLLILGLGFGFIISVFSYDTIKLSVKQLPEFNWQAMLTLDAMLVVIVSLSVLWPAWQIIRRDPMQSLREE